MFQDIGLSQSSFASIYLAATLCAGLLLNPCGVYLINTL